MIEPLAAGEVAGRLWGYGHRNSTIQMREIVPAAAEYSRRVYGALQSLSEHERTYYRERFVDGFRAGVGFWGTVEGITVSRSQKPDSGPPDPRGMFTQYEAPKPGQHGLDGKRRPKEGEYVGSNLED